MIDFAGQAAGRGPGRLAEVSTTEPFTVPMSIVDEVLGICERLGVSP